MCVFSSDCVESYTGGRTREQLGVEHASGTGVAFVHRMQWVDACLFQILTRVVDYTSDLPYIATSRSSRGTEMKTPEHYPAVPNDLAVVYNKNIVAPAISCILYRRGSGGKVVVVVWQVTASTEHA